MDLIFTDLDGTLLDRHTYSWEAARPALEQLNRRGIPWVPVTSKTRAEVEPWRQRLDHRHPFIVENGGAAFVPRGYFARPSPEAVRRDAFEVFEWGRPYAELVTALETAARASRCRVRGFHEMTEPEVAALCDLSPAEAALARRREYDEPFVILDPDRTTALGAAIADLGYQWTHGGRFCHILGRNDKAAAVAALTALFAREHGAIRTIGLGDGLNDASFLNAVDVPVLIRSSQIVELAARVPRGQVTHRPGPEGWNEAVLALIGG